MSEVELHRPAGADLAVPDSAWERIAASRSPNTVRGYEGDWARFGSWCAADNRTPLPATGQTFAAYADHLATAGKSPATIDRAMGVIRAKHRDAGFEDQPHSRAARMVLKAYRREWAAGGSRVRKATPAVIQAIRAMTDACDPGTVTGVRDRAVILLGFALMARRSELAALDIGDIGSDGDDGIGVFIRQSKTDQDARGTEVPVLFGSHPDTCPVRAVRAWLALLASHGITEGALFRPVDRHGRIGGTAAAAGKRAARLSGHSVSEIVRRSALRAGLADPDGYRGHSLRAGAPTSAYAAGAAISSIAELGRWSPRSPVVLGYIRAVDKWKNHPMRGVGL